MRALLPLCALFASLPTAQLPADLREAYDVQAYELALEVQPERRHLGGSVRMTAVAQVDGLSTIELDLTDELEVIAVHSASAPLEFEHADGRIRAAWGSALSAGDEFVLRVEYGGSPGAENDFDGFHWVQTQSGAPWINTSCQGTGAHAWWPCKSSYYHPEDKPERVSMDITVPEELYAVSNGRLEGISDAHEGRRTFRWRHPYPLETYTVTLNVAPYVVVENELELEGFDEPVPWNYYVLPEDAEKAAVQFTQMPELIRIFSEAFGPWPFPDAKIALVQTNFWGMEHSTAVAYGSSFPLWIEQNGGRDPWGGRNRWFDYILVHEMAHEWWGNAVSATHWGDFWIHEGFGTYAEGVYVEGVDGREAADRYFAEQMRGVNRSRRSRLYRGADVNSGEAYAGIIYSKGATVLHTLRHFVDDDEAWWTTLRQFNQEYRYGNASTEDFQAVLERNTGREWEVFMEEWVYGEGVPRTRGSVSVGEGGIQIELTNEGTGSNGFHLPLDLAWREGESERSERVWVAPGEFAHTLAVEGEVSELRLVHLDRMLGVHRIEVR